ncbi:MAG: thiamine pyrophosphate-binding protein, partial [Kiloniellales bacterium]
MTIPGPSAGAGTAAAALVETLARHQVDRVFCVPGESYLAVLDALYDRREIDLVSCRHEAGAGFMAVADAKMTGRPGIAFVSRGPGAGNAAIAVHTAGQDAVPLILFVGQVERKDRGRGAFQEVDYTKTFADMAKWVVEVDDPNRLPETVARAYLEARTGTPGAVVVSLPEDMLRQPTGALVADEAPAPAVRPSADQVTAVARHLARAERPLLIAGGGARSPAARQALAEASRVWRLPVATSFKNQDLFTNEDPHFAGHLGYGAPAPLIEALSGADLVLAVGTRLGDITTQNYTLIRAPQTLIHVYPDPAQLGRVFEPAVAVVADAEPFLTALAARNPPPHPLASATFLRPPKRASRRREPLASAKPGPAKPGPGRDAWCRRLHGVHADLARFRPKAADDGVDFGHVVQALAETLEADAVLTGDAGNFNSWAHRHFPFRSTQLLLGAASGAMGMGVPAAVAAALRFPERQVVGLIGDGGFLMTGNELATAVHHGAAVRLIVSNNNSFGTIRLHQ